MSIIRRFLIPSSMARLVTKERGGRRVTEGYFPHQADRSSYVHIEGDVGSLVLITSVSGIAVEERTEVPRSHAEALLDVTPGKVDYVLSTLKAGDRDIHVSRFVRPGPLDLISVEFEREDEARSFRAPLWFGPEVTDDVAYQKRSIALDGLPSALDIPLSNSALNSLLDTFENRMGSTRPATPPQSPRQSADQRDRRRPNDKPAAGANPDNVGHAQSETSSDENDDFNLNIEDNVIRELARSLRPQRR